ncbi:YhgE/Pip domain-containing protein [Halobacillus salinarum]|uniref:YhgE/Pip domain-containing protein n=1 Tax=Halobacillus salinarum TaxID=2932257 RepID=A0ABY4EGK8_9BACI|nr:YhgE/Pip domain-containing protein [Halobacillus salinarum]UOQ43582.1 YhgE/Pip domain-containing protein [Halobacillus salinarum]
MNGIKLWFEEFKHMFTNRKRLIPFLAVLLIPLIYSGVFLWAFWNPYGNLDELPVAVVNSDKGADYNEEHLEVGKEFVDQLEEDGEFDYHFVSKEKGYEGIEKNDYYMLVEIPENFSSRAATILDEKPKKLQLKYVVNEGENYISSRISDSALDQMKAKLSDEMTETYADAMFAQFNDLKSGLADASSKAEDLNQGAEEVDNGAATLRDKLKTFSSKQLQLANGTETIKKGTADIADSSQQLSQGLTAMNDKYGEIVNGAEALHNKTEEVQTHIKASKQGADQLSQGLSELSKQSQGLPDAAKGLNDSLASLSQQAGQISSASSALSNETHKVKQQLAPIISQLPEEEQQKVLEELTKLEQGTGQLSQNTGKLAEGSHAIFEKSQQLPEKMKVLVSSEQKLKQGALNLSSGQTQLYDGFTQFSDKQGELVTGMDTFGGKLQQAAQGAEKLAGGASQLNDGANELFASTNKLADGSQQLQKGASDLSEGTNRLSSGANDFKTNLSEASSEANDVKTSDKTEDMMAKPVEVNKNSLSEVPNYGTGFTPYFLSLGLFVGALLITIVFPVREPVAAPKNAFSWFISKFGMLMLAGIVQALIVASVILFGLDLEVGNVLDFYLLSMITSLTFMALIQMLVTPLGDPGRFIGIMILILQLTTSAGTFPLELIPQPLQLFHSFLPMTYSIDAFRSVISEGNVDVMWQDAGTLGLFFAGFVAVTILYLVWNFRKKYYYLKEQTI